jgi:predicted DsbA family dithiol-disulfide isomerase
MADLAAPRPRAIARAVRVRRVSKVRVDIWADVACPWCYIGKRQLDRALGRFAHRDRVEIVWRAFELDPMAPRAADGAPRGVEQLARRYGMPVPQAQALIDDVTEAGRRAGVELRLDRMRASNTFDAHRLLQLAARCGKQGALVERLLRAMHVEGRAIGEREVLAELAHQVGLGGAEVGAVLDGDRFAAEVRRDESVARQLGITGVPFHVFGGRFAVSGAQPAEMLVGALERGWAELRIPEPEPVELDAARVLDGCA